MDGNSQPGTSNSSSGDYSSLPRGLLGRKGVPVGRGARLPSLRGPRDLTLTSAPKRTFVPNIPVRRDRSKNADLIEPNQAKQETSHDRRNRNTLGDRGRGRGRGEYIQLQGTLFGQGPAISSGPKRNRGSRGGGGGGGSRDGQNYIPVPKFTASPNMTKEMKEEEEMMLKELLRDDFIDDLKSEKGTFPVQLPLLSTSVKQDSREQKDILSKIKVKKEHMNDTDIKEVVHTKPDKKLENDEKSSVSLHGEVVKDYTTVDLFTNIGKDEQFLFLQFPDCVSGVLPQEDNDSRAKSKKETEADPETVSVSRPQEKSVPEMCSINSLPEGLIGKLRVHKSGKTQLTFGSVILNVEMGTPTGFLQDVVNVKVDQDRGDMSVLGQIQYRLVCSPDMDSLLTSSGSR